MYQNRRKRDVQELTWPDSYYVPASGEERFKLLDAALSEEDSEENRLRFLLWEFRYGQIKKNDGKPKTDYFMKLWMDLEFASGRTSSIFGVKKVIKEIKKDLEVLGFNELQEYGELGQELLYQEMVQAGRYYFELSATDKNYNSELFGLKQISDDKFFDKITEDVYRICYRTPKAFGLQGELELFTKAVTEALQLDYPELIDDLHRIIEKQQ